MGGRVEGGKAFIMEFIDEFPSLFNLVASLWKYERRLHDTMGEVANPILTKLSKEKEAGTLGESEEKSILGLLSVFTFTPMFGNLTQLTS